MRAVALTLTLALVMALCASPVGAQTEPEWVEADWAAWGFFASVAVDSRGGVHVVWYDSNTSSIDYSFYLDGRLITTSTVYSGPASWPRLALGPGNLPVVVYNRVEAGTDIIVFASLEAGLWTRQTLVTDVSLLSPDVRVTSKGTVIVAAVAEVAEGENGWIMVLTNEGGQWARESITVPASGPVGFFRGLALTSNERPALAVTAGSKAYLLERQPGGWVTEEVADMGAMQGAIASAFVLYPQGQPLVIYEVAGSDWAEVWTAERGASGWTGCRLAVSAVQPAGVVDPGGIPRVVYLNFTPIPDSPTAFSHDHSYAYRDPGSEVWVKTLLPPGPYGPESKHGNIVVGASVDRIHIFRGLASKGLQYLTRPAERFEPASTQEGTFDPTLGGRLEGSGPTLTAPPGVVAAAPGSTLTLRADVIDREELEDFLACVGLPEGATAIGRAFALSAALTENGQTGEPGTFDVPVSLTVELTADELAAVTNTDDVGLFRVSPDGAMAFAGGRFVDGQLTAGLWSFSLYVLAEVDLTFVDLPGHWARADVELMASKYVVKGLPGGVFEPGGPVTRAQFACMLVRAMNVRPADLNGAAPAFSDVGQRDWFYGELTAAVGTGIIKGYEDGTFRPNAPVTREQVAVMVARALVADGRATALSPAEAAAVLAPFRDRLSVSSWAAADLAIAVSKGIVTGQTATTLDPQRGATRATAAVMIARYWRMG